MFFYANNDAYVMQTWYYSNSIDSTDYLYFPSRFETYRVFRYGQEIQKIQLEKDENKINHLEYYNKCIKYLEEKSYLNKKKDYDFFDEFDNTQPKTLYILRGEHLLFYNDDYFNAMLDFNKVIEIENILQLSKAYIKENKGFAYWNHDLANAYLNRGICKTYLEDFQSAIKDFDKYISLNPYFFKDEVYYERGCTKLFGKNYFQALEDFNKYLSNNPNEGKAYYFRGSTKYELKNRKGACLDWSKAGELGIKDAYEKIKKHCQ
jgi:tetratricopeptide (TPR) repeat protein